MKTITVERTVNVPLEKVWAVASDFSKPPGPSFSVIVEKAGDPKSHGIGTERTITLKNTRVCERLESIEPPNYFTYKMISGAPVKDYLGKAEFKPKGNNSTEIKWSATFTPKFPGTAWIIARETNKIINQIINELENIK